MKLRQISAVFLILVFLYCGLASGAVPVRAEETLLSRDPEAALPLHTPTPPVSSPVPSPEPSPAATNAPAPAAAPIPETPSPTAAPSSVTVLSTTIRGDSVLDNDTGYSPDIQAMLETGPGLSLPARGYQILIIHTHATEAYTRDGGDVYEESDEYRTTDSRYSVVRVGEELAEALRAYGLNVLHDEGLYDYPSYTSSYVRSGEAIEEYLEAYPGIVMVIDLHRDALGEGDTIYKTVATVEGTDAAQIMFVMGSDENLEHPYWETNLSLALTLHNLADKRFPHLMRPVYLCPYRYNQQLTPGSLLMEVGTSGNTLQEAIAAVKFFADAVGPTLAAWVAAA